MVRGTRLIDQDLWFAADFIGRRYWLLLHTSQTELRCLALASQITKVIRSPETVAAIVAALMTNWKKLHLLPTPKRVEVVHAIINDCVATAARMMSWRENGSLDLAPLFELGEPRKPMPRQLEFPCPNPVVPDEIKPSRPQVPPYYF